MRTKFIKLIIPCLMSIFALAGCGDEVPGDEGYYSGYDLDLFGGSLEHELQRLCFDTHKTFIKYGGVNKYYNYSSKDDRISVECPYSKRNDKKSWNELCYTTKNVSSASGNREHVWACANSNGLWSHEKVDDGYKGGGSDLYHVKLCNYDVNTARGNSKFVDFSDQEFDSLRADVKEVGDGGPYKLKIYGAKPDEQGKLAFAEKAEPNDNYKGDIARIILYLWIHYGYRGNYYNHQDMVGTLDIMQIMGYPTLERCQEKLVEWNDMDLPSQTEKLRNNTVQGIQGNRNPFVDHPELAGQLFGL